MALDAGSDMSFSRRAMKAELLDAETELKLAYAWRDHRDEQALHRLINAYMRLAISMAAKFKITSEVSCDCGPVFQHLDFC